MPDRQHKQIFSEGMGMLVNKNDLGFGKRSWRYSMLVKDGVIEKMFIEPEKPGDPFEVSDADTMLEYINPNATKPDQVVVFTRDGCEFCAKAKNSLSEAGYECVEVPLNHGIRTKVIGALTTASTLAALKRSGTQPNHASQPGFTPCVRGRQYGAIAWRGNDWTRRRAHRTAWALQMKLSVGQILEMPFYHPTVEEGLRTALRDAQSKLQQAQTTATEARVWAAGGSH